MLSELASNAVIDRTYEQTAGFLSAHGRAASSCAATRNSVASSPNLAVNIEPIGRPVALQLSGTDIDGCPLALYTGVHGMNANVSAAAVRESVRS